MNIDSLFDRGLLERMISDGYVRVQTHPTLPLSIYNYTEKAAYEGVWNDVTLTCRGLIVDQNDRRVVARPFRKFFNHGQTGAPVFDLNDPVVTQDKVDGSLGILYPTPDGWAIATRGSFASDQALHATEVWREKYAGRFSPMLGVTYLFEILYPANRIVVDYGDLDDLVHLGYVHNATGRSSSPDPYWPGRTVAEFPYRTLADALAAKPRPNAEGLVVRHVASDERVKIKQEDYVALHKIVTGLSAKTVWKHLVDGKELDELIEPLPDEFHNWVRETAKTMTDGIESIMAKIWVSYYELSATLPKDYTRKDLALAAKGHQYAWAFFNIEDGRDIRPKLWQFVEPHGDVRPSNAPVEEAV